MLKGKGQSTVEYAAFTVIVIAALLTVGVYFKRGIQGRWKQAVDDVGEQYDPRVANGAITQRLMTNSQTRITTIETPDNGIWTMRADTSNTLETKTGSSRVAATP